MSPNTSVKSDSALDFDVIWEALRAHPEAYVNFGEYWWTLKRMLGDWAEENRSDAHSQLIRGTSHPKTAVELEESEVYRFLDEFSGADDFRDWISYVNPRLVWDESLGEEIAIDDPEWEENFL